VIREWSVYEVLALQRSAEQDDSARRALEQWHPEIEAARARGDWQPVETMNRSTFERFVIEHPDSKVTAPAALVWSRPEIALLDKATKGRATYLFGGELALADREGRIHSGFARETPAIIAHEADAKVALGVAIRRAKDSINDALDQVRSGVAAVATKKTLEIEIPAARAHNEQDVLLAALEATTPAWPYDRLTGWAKLYQIAYASMSQGGRTRAATPLMRKHSRVDKEYARLRQVNAKARAKHGQRVMDLYVWIAAAHGAVVASTA
jgi:hypothetical protein